MGEENKDSQEISVEAGIGQIIGLLKGLGGGHPSEDEMRVLGSAPDLMLEDYYSVANQIGSQVFNGFNALDEEVQRIEGIMTKAVTELGSLEDSAVTELQSHLKVLDSIDELGNQK